MSGSKINMGVSGREDLTSFSKYVSLLRVDSKTNNRENWLLQQGENGKLYAINQHGALRNTLVRIVVAFGAICGCDLHQRLHCPTKERTLRVAEQFNDLMKKNGSDRLSSILVKMVLDSEPPSNAHDSLKVDEKSTLTYIPIDKKENLKDYILADQEPYGKAAEILVEVGISKEFLQDENCRRIYNLFCEAEVAREGKIGSAERIIMSNCISLKALDCNKGLAVELCEIEEAVKGAVLRMDFANRSSKNKFQESLFSLFHPKLFVKGDNPDSSLVRLRRTVFEDMVAKAMHDLRLNNPGNFRDLARVLSNLMIVPIVAKLKASCI